MVSRRQVCLTDASPLLKSDGKISVDGLSLSDGITITVMNADIIWTSTTYMKKSSHAETLILLLDL